MTSHTSDHVRLPSCTYLAVSLDGERPILQLIWGKARQDIRKVSRDIWSGGERNPLVAVTASRHFPARDIEVEEPVASG